MSAQVKLSSSPRSAIVFRQHAIRRSASTAIRSSRQVQAVRADLAATKYNLRLACCTKSTPPDQVQQYLEVLEKASKTESLVEDFPANLNGKWRLVFATPAPIPAWAYIPVIEDTIIDTEKGTIALKSFLGPFEFTFSGKANFEASPEQGKYDMNFAFDSSEISVFGNKKKNTREPKPKTYSFFLLQDDLAAVNSSATGGKTLMYRGNNRG